MSTRILSKEQSFGLLMQPRTAGAATQFFAVGDQELAWANPAAAGANFNTMYVNAGTVVPDPNPAIEQYQVMSQTGANEELERFYINANTGIKTVPFAGPVFKKTASAFFALAAQAVSEGASGPYLKTFTSGTVAGAIDFRNDVGWLGSCGFRTAVNASDGYLGQNGIVNTLNLTWDFDAIGVARLVQMDGTLVFSTLTPNSTLNGTWGTSTLDPFSDDDAFSFSVLSFDAVDLTATAFVKRFSFSINNNVKIHSQTTNGIPSGWDTRPVCTANIMFDLTDDNETILGDHVAGAAVDITMANGIAAGSDGHFSLDLPNCRISGNPYSYNEDFAAVAVPLKCLQSASTSPFTLAIADNQDWAF